ncbi:MAG TPA: rhodanese-related sulfurtransferase [Myxococcota bacterium]
MVDVAAFYRFAATPLPGDVVVALVDSAHAVASVRGVCGSILIATEGVNGTIAGARDDVDAVLDVLRAQPGLEALRVQWSTAPSMPFHRLKVEKKREIVTFHQPAADPTKQVGTYVTPEDWNAVVDDNDVVVIDARNDFEVALGSFAGAVNPQTTTFTELAAWFDANLDPARDTKVAMFCTGGIRCEKASSYLLDKGFKEVLHLDGGILGYLAKVPEADSRFSGECFVFDQRVSLGHGLAQGTAKVCHACYRAVDEATLQSPLYEEGVSCPACHGQASAERLASRRERQRQVQLAIKDGRKHIGDVMPRQPRR